MERVKGIEPSQPAWKAGALPLSYTRTINSQLFESIFQSLKHKKHKKFFIYAPNDNPQ